MTSITSTAADERFFAGGDFVAPSDDARILLTSPVDLSEIGRAVDSSAEDVDRAVRAAREAFDSGPWPRMSLAERADLLDRLADELERRAGATSDLVTAEIGQPVRQSRPWVGVRPITHLRYYAKLIRETDIEEERRPNLFGTGDSIIQREPRGVAALIVPWNHPQATLTLKLAPALAAGCTLVVKPAPETSLDVFAFAEASIAAGFPPGVINIVPGGNETGRALVAHPGIDKIAFTGSSAAGREIAAEGGRRLIPVTLELGGKSAGIVLESADLDVVFAGLRTAFDNSGQVCAMQSRVLAPRSMYELVRDRLVDLSRELVLGDPADEATDLGPLVSKRSFERVTAMIDRARDAGATVVQATDGLPGTGYYYPPTIITDAAQDSEIVQEEVFGPVVTVLPYDTVDDAVRIANDSHYGLAGAVYGAEDEALAVAKRIQTGSIGLNGYKPDFNTPYGGYKDSGLGREFAPEAVRNYQETKSIWR